MKSYGKRSFLCGLTLLCALALSGRALIAQQSGQSADVILSNGKILTVDKNFSTVEAIAIQGDRIAAVGTNQQVLAMRGPGTQVIDLKGRTVVPGLLNTHVHLNDDAETDYGAMIGYDKLQAFPINWSAVHTVNDVLNQIKLTMEKYQVKPGQWIYFAGKGSGMSPEAAQIMLGDLTRWDLDKVPPDNPIAMGMTWPNDNGLLVNSKAIDIMWADHGDFIRKYGRFWVDSTGRPDGHLESPANRVPWAYLPEPRPEDLGPIYKLASEELNARGVSGISVQFPDYAVKAIDWLESRGEWNNLRFGYGLAHYFGNVPDLENATELKKIGAEMNIGSDTFWAVSASPSAIDGSGSRSCSGQTRQKTVGDFDQWYPIGQCSMDSEYNGGSKSAKISANYFRDWLAAGARYGYRLANVHAAGDRSVTLTLNLVEDLQRQLGPSAGRGWALDHCRMVNPADIPRAARLGVNFSCAPSLGSNSEAEAYGEKVAETFPSPVKSMLNAGINVSVDSGSFETLETFVTRKDRTGKVWAPQERLSKVEALRVFTQNGANYMLRGDKFGSLETGKLADLIVLDKDYMTVPDEELHTITPQMTMVGGKMVWAHPAFVTEYSLAQAPGMVVGSLKDLEARRKPSGVSRR